MFSVVIIGNDLYYANHLSQWDLCNIASLHAIGVLADDQSIVDEAVDYFKTGVGMGALDNAIWFVHEESGSGKSLGQGQEAGRDQGHSLLDFALLGVVAQQAYNQGDDFFSLKDNLILAGYVSNHWNRDVKRRDETRRDST